MRQRDQEVRNRIPKATGANAVAEPAALLASGSINPLVSEAEVWQCNSRGCAGRVGRKSA